MFSQVSDISDEENQTHNNEIECVDIDTKKSTYCFQLWK